VCARGLRSHALINSNEQGVALAMESITSTTQDQKSFGHGVDHEHHTRPKELWPWSRSRAPTQDQKSTTPRLICGQQGDAFCEDGGHVHRHACAGCARKRAVDAPPCIRLCLVVRARCKLHGCTTGAILDQRKSDTPGGGRAKLTLGVLTPTR
jgi:hypothetical protein